MLARRARLSAHQKGILDFIEGKFFEGWPKVMQSTIEEGFPQYKKREIFYRLENLCLLGFLERQEIGERSGFQQFSYSLSQVYMLNLEGVKRPLSSDESAFENEETRSLAKQLEEIVSKEIKDE
jgi:hypothetical protein